MKCLQCNIEIINNYKNEGFCSRCCFLIYKNLGTPREKRKGKKNGQPAMVRSSKTS